jgi:nucleoid-associated protein YgaU
VADPLSAFQPAQLEIEGDGAPLKCLFNPKEYTVTKTNTWNGNPTPGVSLPKVQFGGGSPQELSLDILLDDMEGDHPIAEDINRLFKMMEADKKFATSGKKNSARPPYVKFAWGKTHLFRAGVKSLSVQFLRFDGNGAPIRAQVKLSLVQVEKNDTRWAPPNPPPQNPTTRAIARMGAHTVRAGDSLQSIAYAAYGDATAWRTIAEANGIDDPLRLRRGSRLLIPALDA